jgi:putative tricarboxylic transport membrane protein
MMKMFKCLRMGAVVFTLIAAICGISPVMSAENYPKKALEFIAPAGAGGGFDLTIRTVAKTLQDAKLVKVPMPVTNKPGGGGGVALAYVKERSKSDSIVVVYSPPLILINLNGSTPLGYKDITPLSRLIADYGCFVVKKGSKYKSIKDVMDALKKDPKSVKICGTSAAGSMDHLQFLKMAKAAGVKDLKAIQYISFQDASASAQVLGGHVDLLTTGLADTRGLIESGDLVALAQTADKRVGTGVLANIPTCKEQGINATFINWRGLFGAKNMSANAVAFWESTLAKMVKTPQWTAACKTNGWDTIYLDSKGFSKFLDETNSEYKSLMTELGMIK